MSEPMRERKISLFSLSPVSRRGGLGPRIIPINAIFIQTILTQFLSEFWIRPKKKIPPHSGHSLLLGVTFYNLLTKM